MGSCSHRLPLEVAAVVGGHPLSRKSATRLGNFPLFSVRPACGRAQMRRGSRVGPRSGRARAGEESKVQSSRGHREAMSQSGPDADAEAAAPRGAGWVAVSYAWYWVRHGHSCRHGTGMIMGSVRLFVLCSTSNDGAPTNHSRGGGNNPHPPRGCCVPV